MLDPKGNTGVYLIFNYVRICSIFRKGNYSDEELKKLVQTEGIILTTKGEKELAITILRLPE